MVNNPFIRPAIFWGNERWHWGVVGFFDFQLSNEKNLGCLGYIGDYTTQLCGDCNKPLSGSLLTNQYNGK